GGTVALAVMRAYPERVNRAVIQGSFARRPLAPAEVLLAGLARYWPGPMSRLPLRRAILHRTHHEPFSNRPEEVWEFFLSRWGAQPMAAVARRALLLHRLDLRPTLAEIRHPVLLVCGDADPLVSPSCEEELLRGLPNVVRVQLENCGHLPLFTHPGTLADLLRGFLLPPGSQPTKLTCRPDGV
ncbi:MAG: alpha/beta hydrolase, partial [Planctomycetes bacterium]|nr:alpha/beta hydrolase [Planctomycetota bacterium]